MRFSDKLPKLRKENNLSQEQLAERLNVSRQAVSKWELGESYPDMDKMIRICKELNCTLEDLLDDGTISNNSSMNNKNNFLDYFQDFLNYITKTVNMFSSMKFKEKIKCVMEMGITSFLLLSIGCIIYLIFSTLILDLLNQIPNGLSSILFTIFNTIIIIGLLILGIIIFLHLFKIRYLDYFITIEDNNVLEKTIEKAIPNEKIVDNKKYIVEDKKEKIIIRDPKHSTYSFFNFLGKMILLMIKFLVLMCVIPVIIMFVGLILCSVISLYHITYGSMFFYLTLAFLGSSGICYVIMYFVYNFILNQKIKYKKSFIIVIISLILIGIGSGLTIIKYMNYEHPNNLDDLETTKNIEYLKVKETTYIHPFFDINNMEYIIDDNEENIRLEITSINDIKYSISENINDNEAYYYIHLEDVDFFTAYKLVKSDLKNNIIRDYDINDFIKVKVYLSSENYQKIGTP